MDFMELLNGRGQAALDKKMGIKILEATPERLVGTMPVEGNTHINATHHKTATKGIVTAVATAISLGRTLCSYNIEITNEDGQRTCTARITCLILND
jgi:acyl-coenzyme A thioesterase PaaI-like protein